MIRKIKNHDFSQIRNLLKEQFHVSDILEDPFCQCFVIEEQSEIIGFISYSNLYDHFDLNYIWIKEEKRKKGLGTQLLNVMLENARENGVSNITLEVSKQNVGARSFYRNYGFVEKAIRKNYYGFEDAILMVLEIR